MFSGNLACDVLLLSDETSLNIELNSLDSSSAVAIDAFRSSFMDWNSMLLP